MPRPTSRAAACGAFALLAIFTAGSPASADVLLEGQKYVQEDVTIDYGVFADRSTWRYETKPGDTLESIARTELGAEFRKAEVAALNPGAGTVPSPNTRLLMPPRSMSGPGPNGTPWWDLLAAGSGGGGPVTLSQPLYPGERFPYSGGSWHLFAVPHDIVSKVRGDPHALAVTPTVLVTGTVGFGGTSSTSDPTRSIVSRYRLELAGDRRLTLRLLEQKRLGRDGRVLTQAVGGPAPMPHDALVRVLLVVSAAAFLALVAVVVRRRWALAPAPPAPRP